MKKILSLLAIGAIVLGMASCGDGNDPSNVTFDIQVDEVGAHHAKVTFTPSNQEVYYYCMVEKIDALFSNGEDIEDIKAVLNENLASMKKGIEEHMQMSFEEWLKMMKDNDDQEAYKKGVFVREDNLLYAETEYIAYACLINNDAEVVGEVTWKTFTTESDPE